MKMRIRSVEMDLTPWLVFCLCLQGILTADWSVNLPPDPICAVMGSSVVIPCSYEFPQSSGGEGPVLEPSGSDSGGHQRSKVLSEMWCLESSRCITPRYVFHSAGIFLDSLYQGRVEFLGEPGTQNCSLKISDLRPSDSGTYVFYAVTNHSTQKMPEQKGVQLLVADSSNAVAVLGPSSDVTVGGAIRLSCCSFPVNPEAQVTWYKTTEAEPMHSGKAWSISRVTWDDSSSYYCQIQSRGRVQKSTQIRVDVQYTPRHTAVSISPSEGLPVALTCSSDANPLVVAFTWYRDAACDSMADLSFYQGRRTAATPTGHTLSSVNITVDTDGLYCCVAQNKHGWQKRTVEVKRSSVINASTSGGKLIIIVVAVTTMLVIIAIAAFFMLRKRKSSRHHSYVLTEMTSSAP